MVMRMDLLN